MQNFKIRWLESHDPSNWGELKTGKIDLEKGKRRILDSYPYIEHWIDDDGWLEGTCEDTIQAEDIEEAKTKAFDEFECEVFDILDENGNLVGTEDGVIEI